MMAVKNKTLSTVLKIVIPFVLIPALIALGTLVFDDKRYLLISFGIAVLALVLFFSGVERKNIGSRRMVVVAVMTACSVAGRFIPFFKPVTALTVITAIWLGPESGFLVGALSALLSNFYFGQGPWTPFQMLAWGLIGLMAGYLSTPLKKHKSLLLLFGVFSGVLFSLIMDVWTVVWYNGTFDLRLYLAAIVSAVPFTALYAISNFIFLFFLSKPFGEKLGRIKIKYGI